MMIEERFSNTLRNIPRMKFKSVTFKERKQDANKNTYEVKRIDRKDIAQSNEFTEAYYKEYWDQLKCF